MPSQGRRVLYRQREAARRRRGEWALAGTRSTTLFIAYPLTSRLKDRGGEVAAADRGDLLDEVVRARVDGVYDADSLANGHVTDTFGGASQIVRRIRTQKI